MCGRYVIFTEEENMEIREIISQINERFKDESPKMRTGEIFPTDTVPIITGDSKHGKVINLFRWGFPNFRQPSAVIINARGETLHEKPTFRNLLYAGRCLVPASGFYEWSKTSDQKKEKYLIRSSESSLVYFAGLYNKFIDKNGINTTRFVIITTQANEQMSQIHDRMPVILNGDAAIKWISPEYTESASLLIPYRSQLTLSKTA